MSTYTTNYNFEKPEGTDFVSPTPYNNNFEALDSMLKNNFDQIDDDITELNEHVITESMIGLITGSGRVYVEFTSSGTWTAPPYIKDNKVYALVFGGGGGAGGSKGSSSGVKWIGGGGGGGHMKAGILTVVPGQTYDVIVGAGGEYGKCYDSTSTTQYFTSNGKKGGTSSFMSLSAEGGDGGTGGYNTNAGSDETGATPVNGGSGGSGGGAGGYNGGTASNYIKCNGSGGSGSYGGGGGCGLGSITSYDVARTTGLSGGNGGKFGGGGGASYGVVGHADGSPGKGGTYGGNGGLPSVTLAQPGTPAKPPVFFKDVDTYINTKYVSDGYVTNVSGGASTNNGGHGNNYATGAGGGGGGYGSIGGKASGAGGGGGGFFSNGGNGTSSGSDSYPVAMGGGGGGFFAQEVSIGGGGYFSKGSGNRAAGGQPWYGNGGSGVVALWYFVTNEEITDSYDIVFGA